MSEKDNSVCDRCGLMNEECYCPPPAPSVERVDTPGVQGTWISCLDALPAEELGYVLVYYDPVKYDEWAMLSEENQKVYDDNFATAVDVCNTLFARHWAKEANWLTHWMPYPAAPAEQPVGEGDAVERADTPEDSPMFCHPPTCSKLTGLCPCPIAKERTAKRDARAIEQPATEGQAEFSTLQATLAELSICEFTERNCSSLDVASQRIRRLGREALKQLNEIAPSELAKCPHCHRDILAHPEFCDDEPIETEERGPAGATYFVPKSSLGPAPEPVPRVGEAELLAALRVAYEYPVHWDLSTCIAAALEDRGLVESGRSGIEVRNIIKKWLTAALSGERTGQGAGE